MDEKILFGKKVSFYRKKRKLTQTQFAEILNVKRSTIGRIERGEFFPKSNLLFKLPKALDTKLVNLFDFEI